MLGRLLMEVPYAVGSLSYLMGAHLYKKAAVEAYALHRRTKGRKSAILKWARVEVIGGCSPSQTSTTALRSLCAALKLQHFDIVGVLRRNCYDSAWLRAWLPI